MPRETELIYWDSNVFLSYVNGDVQRLPAIDAVLEAVEESEGERLIVTSTIAKVEVAYTASERSRRALDEKIADEIDNLWRDDSVIGLIELSEAIVTEARRLMRLSVAPGWKLRPMDAIHLASAKWLRVAAFHTYDLADLKRFEAEIGCSIAEPFVPQPRLPNL